MEELELTYLAKELPSDLTTFPSKVLLDIYLPSTAKHPILRVRKRGDEFEITKKQPVSEEDFSRQIEETIPLAAEEYTELSTLRGKRIEKIRFAYQQDGTEFEIDVFRGGLEGLVLIDVEFTTVEAKDSFTLPTFCLADVTQEPFAAGGMLCGKTYADIENNLERFGYQKLFLA